MWCWMAFFFQFYRYYLVRAGGRLTWGFCVNSSRRRPTVWLSFLPKYCKYYSSSLSSFVSLAPSQTFRRKPPLTPILNIATCYTCDNDGIWGPCTLGTPCSTVDTGHQVDYPVWGQTNMSNIWCIISHISEWFHLTLNLYAVILEKLSQHFLHETTTPHKHTRDKCYIFPSDNPYRFPAKWDVPRSYKHSIEVVVKDKDSPIDEHDEVNAATCRVKRPVPDDGVKNGHGRAYSYDRQCYDWTPVTQSPNLMEVFKCHKRWKELHLFATSQY